MQKFKVSGQLVPKTEWKQTNGRTDGWTEVIALPTALMQSIKIHYLKTLAGLMKDQGMSNLSDLQVYRQTEYNSLTNPIVPIQHIALWIQAHKRLAQSTQSVHTQKSQRAT